MIVDSLFFQIIICWLFDKRIIILIINIFHLFIYFQIINSNLKCLFFSTFYINAIRLRLKNRQTRLRLNIIFKNMVKSIINNLAIKMLIIITLSQFMKSAQYFLFLLIHRLFCISSLFFRGMSPYLPLPIIPNILIKAIRMAYFLLNVLLRSVFWPSFVLILWILSFMHFYRLIMCHLRHFHLAKGFDYLVDVCFCFFPLVDI